MSKQSITIPNYIVFDELLSRLAKGVSVRILLVGESMYPFLRNARHYVTLSPFINDSKIVVGDVYLFSYAGHILLHRCVAVKEDKIVMQGDNSYSHEEVSRPDIKAVLVAMETPRGVCVKRGSMAWRWRSTVSLCRKKVRLSLTPYLTNKVRKRLSVVYFVALAVLMWAPVNALGIPLNNFVFGLRADHLLHASVYLPCAFFLFDWLHHRKLPSWLFAILIGVVTESVQYLLPYRGFDINDLVANFIGATLGWLVLRMFA